MLRIPAALAVVGLTALALAGCSAASAPASCDRQTSSASALDLIGASGAPGSPAADLAAPVNVEKTVFADTTVGDGPAVTSDTQDVQFAVTLANGETGQTLLTSGTQVLPVSAWTTDYDGFAKMLSCATEGSRIVGAIPTSDLSEAAAANFGLAEGESLVAIMDLQKVYLAAADGAPQYNDRRGMPTVVLAPDGRPGVIVPDADAPTELVVQVLKRGDGAAVADSDSIRVQYTGLTWADREVFDSTWEKGASASVTLDGVVPGFAQALKGQTVGSQILVVIPPDLGYGADGSGAIPGDATLVFVIDILGIDAPATP